MFAQRTRRTEGLLFRTGYALFRVAHRILVGRDVEVGNFSALPRQVVGRMVAVSEMWNHYAAAVFHSRIPIATVPVPRARRLAGRSQMTLTSLITHGLSAISVYGDLVGVRALLGLGAAAMTIVFGIGGVIAVKLITPLAIPGWATTTIGLLVLLLVNLLSISLIMVIFTLRARTESGFMPLRDYGFFILDTIAWHGPADEQRQQPGN